MKIKIVDILKKIPWKDILDNIPVRELSEKIWDKFNQKKDGLSIDQRLEIIEETEKDQQAYIAQLEDVINKNSDYTHLLSMRINILFVIVFGTLVYLILS